MRNVWLALAWLLWLPNGLVFAQGCSTLTMSGPPSAAPASWVMNGKLVGAAVEYTQAVARAAGVTNIEVRTFSTWGETLQAAFKGDIDVIFSANRSEERDRHLDYVRPAMSVQFLNVVVRRGEEFDLLKLSDFEGRSGAASAGETYGNGYFGTFVQQKLILQRAPTIGQTMDLLLEKKVDFIFGWENAVYEQMMVRNLGSRVQVLDTYPTEAEAFIAFAKRSKCTVELREAFAQKVAAFNSQYLYRQLMKKHREIFNESMTRPN